MDWKTLFFSARGRIARRDFWIGFVFVMIASGALNLIPGNAGKVIGLLVLWPQVCIHAKRLHDMGRTAWLMLIPFLITVACTFVAAMTGVAGATDAAAMLGLGLIVLAAVVGLSFLLWVGLTKGTPGPNRFGEAPVPL